MALKYVPACCLLPAACCLLPAVAVRDISRQGAVLVLPHCCEMVMGEYALRISQMDRLLTGDACYGVAGVDTRGESP